MFDDLAWHRQALIDMSFGLEVSVNPTPECGWFKRRLVRKGPWVPARIWIERQLDDEGRLIADEIQRCEVGGVRRDPDDQWLWLAGHPISEVEYQYMMKLARHCAWYEPDQPQANPRRPVDWNIVRLPTFERK